LAVLRGRVAWAPDWVGDPALGAVFESLPGASFVVNGAPLPSNSALTSADAELYLTSSLTLLASSMANSPPARRPTPSARVDVASLSLPKHAAVD
jgi:uncharacterized protein with beta-barrel porin domain